VCQKPARQQGLGCIVALPYGRASDTNPVDATQLARPPWTTL